MASAGLLPGMITCLFSGSVAAFGLYLLSLCAAKAPHRRSSFFAVAQLTFPKAAVFFDAAIAVKCFGVSIRCETSCRLALILFSCDCSYLIIIKGLMPNVVASLYHDLVAPDAPVPVWALSGQNWIILFSVILVPLAFLKHLHSLRHTSYVALFSVGASCPPVLLVPKFSDIAYSLPHNYCHQVLLVAYQEYALSWGSAFDTLYTPLCLDISRSGVRVYLRSECLSSAPMFVFDF